MRSKSDDQAYTNAERSHTTQSTTELLQLQALQDQLDNQVNIGLWEDDDGDLQKEQQLWNRIEQMQDNMDKNMSLNKDQQIDVHIALGSTASLTVGFVSWILRGGSLLASLITTLPLLNRFDPLPVVNKNKKKKDDIGTDEDGESEKSQEDRVDDMFSAKSSSDDD